MSTSVLERPVAIAPSGGGVRTHARPDRGAWADRLAIGVIVGAWAIGVYFRLWFVFHAPINSDESVVGLIAQGGLHGHFQAFFGGQVYGGTAEAYLASIAFAIFGQSGVVEALLLGVLAAVAALMTVRVARRMVPARVAQLIGALAFVGPAVTLRDSVRTYGFRGVAVICGLGLLLASLRILDGDRRMRNFVAVGALLGLGWWTTPEIAYFVLPAGLLFVGAFVRNRNAGDWTRGFLVAVFASHFASISPGPSYYGNYSQRLGDFFRYTFPMQTGSIVADNAQHVLGGFYWPALIVMSAALLAAIVLCVASGGRAAAIAIAVVVFPFIYAIPPQTGAWMDGRYAVYFAPLLALVLGIGVHEAVRRLRMLDVAAFLLMSIVVVISASLCAAGVFQLTNTEAASFTHGWGNPDAPTLAAIVTLERHGITTGYADYWVAYKLDFLSRGHLQITVAGYDDDRVLPIDAVVLKSKAPAWLFVPADVATLNGTQFTIPVFALGPDNGEVNETQFRALLHRMHIGFQVVNTDVLTAIIPDRAFTPYDVRMPGSLPGLA
jgi:hypothetical protein